MEITKVKKSIKDMIFNAIKTKPNFLVPEEIDF